MRFKPGDEVIVVDGDSKGEFGIVTEYFLDLPMIDITENGTGNVIIMVAEDDLEPLPPKQEEVKDVPAYDFPIPQKILEAHLEWLITRSLERLGDVGPKEAFFGFQEFEGKTASEVIMELMGKLEEGVAMFAQAHVLLGRIVMALETIHDHD